MLGAMNYYGGVSKRYATWKDLVAMVCDCHVKMMIILSHLIHTLEREHVFKTHPKLLKSARVKIENASGEHF